MRKSVNLLVGAWLLLCLALTVGGLAVTTAPGERVWAWPVPGGAGAAPAWTGPAALVLGGAAALLLAVAVNFAKVRGRARPWAELVLYFGSLFGFVWWVMGPGRPGPVAWAGGGLLLLAAAALKFRLRLRRPAASPWRRWLRIDALLILAPLAAGLVLGPRAAGPSVWVSLLMYPLYAGVQLLVFLVVPADRLQALGVSPRGSALACAALFALAHWPNPAVMLLTGTAMVFWSWQYRHGRPLWQLAMVMGLAATLATQFLPEGLTHHMRVGPRYVRQETFLQLAGGDPRTAAVPLADFLSRVGPSTLGRPVTAAETQGMAVAVDAALRPVAAWHFFISEAYGRRALAESLPPAPPPDRPLSALGPAWQTRIADLANRGADLAWPDYIAFLYREVLGRDGSAGEVAGWTRDLNWSRRKRVVEALLDWRLVHGGDAPVALTAADLAFIQ